MTTASSPGCVVLLIDESAGMGVVIKEMVTGGMKATRPTLHRVATSVNALLNQLTLGADFDLALVGYRTDGPDMVNVGCRWAGPLAGRDFVRISELPGAALRTETRIRKIPAPDGLGVAREESVDFPIWYEPQQGSQAPQTAAFRYCYDLVSRWFETATPHCYAPLVVHITSGVSDDGSPELAVRKLQELQTPAGAPLLFHAHMASSAASVPILYPSNYAYLTLGFSRDLFRRSSPLPDALVAALRQEEILLNPGARGMLYNAKILDLTRLLGLVKTHTRDWLPAAPLEQEAILAADFGLPPIPSVEVSSDLISAGSTAPSTGEKAAIVVFLLDRSIADPYGGVLHSAFGKLQTHANDLLDQLARLGTPQVETAIVSYGLLPDGPVEIRDVFDGPLAGRAALTSAELADGAIRVEESQERTSDGAGGLITIKVKKPVFVELEPTAAAPPQEGFEAACRVVRDWCNRHPTACIPPIVLHLTRGGADPESKQAAAQTLQSASSPGGEVLLYHLVATESPHASIAYPDLSMPIAEAPLSTLRDLSSPLLGRERISQDRPGLSPDARGIVINGKFDLLLDGIQELIRP